MRRKDVLDVACFGGLTAIVMLCIHWVFPDPTALVGLAFVELLAIGFFVAPIFLDRDDAAQDAEDAIERARRRR